MITKMLVTSYFSDQFIKFAIFLWHRNLEIIWEELVVFFFITYPLVTNASRCMTPWTLTTSGANL